MEWGQDVMSGVAILFAMPTYTKHLRSVLVYARYIGKYICNLFVFRCMISALFALRIVGDARRPGFKGLDNSFFLPYCQIVIPISSPCGSELLICGEGMP